MFKNRIYKAAILAVIAMFSCSSCNKYLTLRPQNGVTSDQFFQTKEQLQSAVIGIYNGLCNAQSSSLKAPSELFFIWGEIRADFIAPGPGMTADETSIIQDNILSSNSIVVWGSIYRIINLCNNVIDNGPNVINVDNTLTQTALNGYLGEALAIRALMYFYLVRSFGDVPLKLTYTATDGDLQQLAKTPQAAILTQIVADLKTAEGYALPTYGVVAYDKGRITKFTVETIQADVYLWMDDFADCITACDKVINSGKYGLVAGNFGWFGTLYATGNSSEGIFELQFDTQQLNTYFGMFEAGFGLKPRYLANASLIDNWYTTDLVVATDVDIRGIDVAIHVNDQSIYKFIAINAGSLRTAATSYAHWIMYRYADVLLMKAEACIYSSRGQDALDLITTIRTRANALIGTLQSPSPTDVAGLTNYLVAERAREFAFEGKRWYDLLRNAKRNSFARLDLLTASVTSSVPPLNQQSAINKIKDPNSLYFPVPLGDIQDDPNLIQNPFYK